MEDKSEEKADLLVESGATSEDVLHFCSASADTTNWELNKGKRKRRTASQNPVCPVCGLTLRFGEIKDHYKKELSSLDDLSDPTSKSSIKWTKRHNSSQSKNKSSKKPVTSSQENEENEEDDKLKKSVDKRLAEFTKVKDCRRFRHAKILLGKWSVVDYDLDDPSGYHLLICPVCEVQIEGNEDELTDHVQNCLKRKDGDLDTDDASNDESIDEYTWAGQTRIRVTSLLEPGVYACDGEPIKLEMTNEDEELDIECDELMQFGQTQYTEKDVIPCSSDIPGENEALGRIRAAISSSEQMSTNSNESTRSRWRNGEGKCNGEIELQSQDTSHDMKDDSDENKDSAAVIKSLQKRLVSLNDELLKEKQRCLICMEGFDTPLVSVVCWHVYCEECWLRTLGAKKLCPQCSTITSPSDLRKIYI